MGLTRVICFLQKASFSLLPFFFLLFIVTSGLGNTAQYIYDDLGRLVRVIDDQGDETVYTYDAVGNLLSITKTTDTNPVAIVDMNPSEGDNGTIVTIYGKGFSSTSSENSVSFNSTAAAVSSSTSSTIITAVPVGATTGRVTVQTPTGNATSPKDFIVRKPSTITISPSFAFLSLGRSQQFTATITGISDTSLVWSVDGIEGGSAVIGTITNGLYAASLSLDQPALVTVSARSVVDPTKSAEVPVYLNVERIVSNSVSVVVQPQPQPVTQGPFVAPSVSVAVHPQPQSGAQGPFVAPSVSVAVLPQPQSNAQGPFVAPSVSVAVLPQPQSIAEGPFVAPSISLYMGPYISSVSPATAVQGSNLTIKITGIGFSSGVLAIDFYLNGAVDPDITAANIQVNPEGTQITADIVVSPTAVADIRLVKITSLGGTSQGYYSDGNIFKVTTP